MSHFNPIIEQLLDQWSVREQRADAIEAAQAVIALIKSPNPQDITLLYDIANDRVA